MEFRPTLTIFCNQEPKLWERIHLLQLLILNEYVVRICRRLPLSWSCRRWWVGCIYGWLGLGDPPAPVVLPPKWPTGWCRQHSEGSWIFALQFVVHFEIHRGSPLSTPPLGCWTSTDLIYRYPFVCTNSSVYRCFTSTFCGTMGVVVTISECRQTPWWDNATAAAELLTQRPLGSAGDHQRKSVGRQR